MKVFKKINANIIYTFKAKYIWIAMLLCMALFFGANIYGADSTDSTGQIIKILKINKTDLILKGEEFSREYVFGCFGNNYWFSVLFPAIVGIATVNRFADEWLNGIYYYQVSRVGKKKFAIIEVVSCFITAFLTMFICLTIFQLILRKYLPSIKEYEDWQYSLVAMLQGDSLRQNLLFFGFLYGRMGALAGIYALFSMLLVIICKDRFFAITIPVMINYLSTKTENFFSIYLFKHAVPDTSKLNYVKFLIPTMYFTSGGLFLGDNGNKSRAAYIMFLLIIAGVLSLIIINIINRKDR